MTTEAALLTERNQLIERLGVQLEKEDQLAPVAARIVATLMLACKQGVTFEQLVDELGASKSTICTHLNTLEASGRLEYFTKPGDRKRYYMPASNRLMRFIADKIAQCDAAVLMQQEIIGYKERVNRHWKQAPEKQCATDINYNLKIFMEESAHVFQRLKKNLTKNQKTQ